MLTEVITFERIIVLAFEPKKKKQKEMALRWYKP